MKPLEAVSYLSLPVLMASLFIGSLSGLKYNMISSLDAYLIVILLYWDHLIKGAKK